MGEFKSILCGVDDAPHSMHALQRAAALARDLSARLTLLHVEPEPRGEALFAPPPAGRGKPPPPEEKWCDRATAIRGQQVELHYATGDAAEQIVAFARKNACDVIVLGSRARAAAALALGSVAARVLVHAHCPVLVVRGGPAPIRAQVATVVV